MKKILFIFIYIISSTAVFGFHKIANENLSKNADYFTSPKIIQQVSVLNVENKWLFADVEAKFNPFIVIKRTAFFTDECITATTLTVNTNGTCTVTTSGNFTNATLSTGFGTGCSESDTVLKDVWYKFTATQTSHVVSLIEEQQSWLVYMQVYNSSVCTTPEPALDCGTYLVMNNLVIGNEYYVRVFLLDGWEELTDANFSLCVRTLLAPTNDECANAIVAPVNSGNTCDQFVNGTLQDATLSVGFEEGCDEWSEPAKDVWFQFTATNATHDITLSEFDGWGMHMEVYDASNGCNLTTPLACVNSNYLILNNFVPGQLYKIRVFNTDEFAQNSFQLCVRIPSPPINDECATPIITPVNLSEECLQIATGTFYGSTLSNGFTNSCDEWSTPVKDVWFKFTATSETHGINFTEYDEGFDWNFGFEVFNDGNCTSLGASIYCGTQVQSVLNNLVVGQNYLIRVYCTEMDFNGGFNICINSLPPNIRVSTTQYTVDELVKDILVGNPCLVSNVTFSTGVTHDPENGNGIAYFNKNNSVFTLEDGILLSTGDAMNVVGPAINESTSGASWVGDQQLFDYMTAQGLDVDEYNDATILEFDFIPTKENFSFDFIFGSNEYGNYQCDFSDAFAFFLTEVATNTTSNLAVVPNSGAPISVTTIRKGIHSPPGWDTEEPLCGDSNAEFFDKCYDLDYNGLDPMTAPVNLKGHTVPMTATATVVPGNTYHIKMVIADRNDSSMDSSVFLLGGSFDIGSIDFGDGLTFENDKALCFGDSYVLNTGLGNEFTFKWFKEGQLIPNQTGASLTVTETGTYKVEANFGDTECSIESSVLIEFYPNLNDVVKNPEKIIVCDDSESVNLTIRESEMLDGISGNYIFEYYPTLNDLQNGSNLITNPTNFSITGPTTVFVKVETSGENSCHAVKELVIEFLPVPTPVSFDNRVVCDGFILPALPVGQKYFSESGGNGTEYTAGQKLGKGEYQIYVYASNKECFKESTFTLIVRDCTLPKGISPNGDGNNDYLDLADYHAEYISIYNRYGTLVYDKKDYRNEWFGHSNKGEQLPEGTYFMVLKTPVNTIEGWIYLSREIK